MSAEAASSTIRTFLAVDLSPEVHATLVAFKKKLAEAIPVVHWVRDQNLHATIKFLGHIPAAQVDAVRRAVTPVLNHSAAFTVQARGLGAFPSPKRPRVVWIGLVSEELPRLAAAVDAGLEPLGFERESRPFRSHITLGRIDAPKAWARLADALRSHVSDDFGSCRIDELTLYRSELQRTGAVYTKLWSVELADSVPLCG